LSTYSTQSPSNTSFSALRLVSGIFYIIAALLSLWAITMSDFVSFIRYNFEFLQSPSGYFLVGLYQLLEIFLLPIGSLFLGVTALASKKFRYSAWISIGLFVVVALFGWVLRLFAPVIFNFGGLNFGIDILRLSWTGSWIDWPLTIFFVAASVLAVVSNLSATSGNLAVATEPAIQRDAMPHSSHTQAVAPSNLPVFALVAAFIVPIAGVILGHISLSQMKRGQIVSDNRGLALAGMVLGYVFIGLSIIVGIVLAVALIINASRGNYYY